jgi:ABC-type sugar transport system, permease component
MILPLIYIVSISLSKDMDIINFGYKLVPVNLDFTSYKYIFSVPVSIINSYMVTISVTVLGTILGVFLCSSLGYVMARKDYRYKKATTFIVFFTLLFNGGLVPWYMLISKYLHLSNTILALILPYAVVTWFVILMKGFLSGISADIVESAKIDGANELFIYFKIILPMSKPAIATISLFYAFQYWNDWWLAMLFIDNKNLFPIQFMLQRIMSNIEFLQSQLVSGLQIDLSSLPTESTRMAMCVLAAGPMLIVFPFFQKYFVKGINMGAIKG